MSFNCCFPRRGTPVPAETPEARPEQTSRAEVSFATRTKLTQRSCSGSILSSSRGESTFIALDRGWLSLGIRRLFHFDVIKSIVRRGQAPRAILRKRIPVHRSARSTGMSRRAGSGARPAPRAPSMIPQSCGLLAGSCQKLNEIPAGDGG
jgi:hypothetical protein